MKLESRWTREAAAIRIDFSISPAVRLVGLPFLGVGAWFLYWLVLSVADVMRGQAGFGEMLGGQILLMVMFLAFAVPGALLMFVRKWIVIRRDSGMIDEMTRYGFYLRGTQTPMAQYQKVRAVLSLTAQKEGNDTVSYEVELPGGKKAGRKLIGLFNQAAPAVAFGKEVAKELNLAFENHTGSDPQIDEDEAAEAEEPRE